MQTAFQTKKPLTVFEQKVLTILQNNQNVTRTQLQMTIFATAINPNADRRIRNAIATLRNYGYVICSNSNGTGYEITTDPAKVRHYVNEQVKRAKTLMRTAHKVKRAYGLRDQLFLSA